ncbi:MAG: patatin-like phospholipase family protein [Gammaproteobacteria bacterium]
MPVKYKIIRSCIFLVLLFLSGCSAHFPINSPFGERSPATQPVAQGLLQAPGYDRSDELLVILAFSGGGMRASAFSYGVLKTLSETRVQWQGKSFNLLDEVDMISSVSGGSFTAAYYGLYGRKILEAYEDDFLKHNVEQALLLRLINPLYWRKLGSIFYNRSELASDYYDEILFKGATFADLNSAPGPSIMINATDLTTGNSLVFHQEQFDWLCSDISSFPVSRAVAASSAVPGLFSVVTLHNYGDKCSKVPYWLESELWQAHPGLAPLAAKIRSYKNSETYPYIHLIDGGLADNLGLRSVMERVALHGGAEQALEHFNLKDIRRILIISANAAAAPNIDVKRSEEPPSTFYTVDAATTVQINLYNRETIQQFQKTVRKWQDDISYARCGRQWCTEDVEFYYVDLSLSALTDEKERSHLQQLPTTFVLPGADVDRLINAADTLLNQSEAFHRFVDNKRQAASH